MQVFFVSVLFLRHHAAMTPDEITNELERSVAFALSQYQYKPPRTHSIDERERYFSAVAEAVVRQLKFTWEFEAPGILRRKPPLRMHDCHPPAKKG